MKILITGGTGLVGTEITKKLLEKGHEVSYLSRNPGNNRFNIPEFKWDPDRELIDLKALQNVESIINLAGATLNKRWTPEYKSTILRSRVDSTRLLFNTVQKENISIKSFISASAVGYYPDSYTREYSEEAPPGSDFLSQVCQKWEQEAQNFEELNVRVARMRIGIVLSNNGGALPQIVKPIKFGVGAPLGNGNQWLAWIHIEDLANMFIHAVEQKNLHGAYNAVGPYSVTNKDLTKEAADALKRPLFLPKVPKAALKIILGEMAEIALASNKCSNAKILESGFKYKFTNLKDALHDLLA